MAIGVVATLPILLKPIVVGVLEDHGGLSRSQVAWVPAVEQLGAGIVSLLIAPFLSRRDRRVMLVAGLSLLLLANVGSLFAGGLLAYLTVRFFAGLGGGAALGLVKANFAGSRVPDRLFATYSVLMLLAGAAASPIIGRLAAAYGVRGLFGTLLILSIPALLLARWAPASGAPKPTGVPPTPAGGATLVPIPAYEGLPLLRSLAGTAFFFAAVGMFWPFAERIGVELGLTAEQSAGVIGVALLAGAAGALLAAIVGAPRGRAPPLAFGLFGSTLSMVLVVSGSGVAAFTAAVCLFGFSWFFTFPYILGTMSAEDPSGRTVVLTYVAQTFFTAAGPVLANLYLTWLTAELPSLAWAGALGFVGAGLFFVPAAWRVDRQRLSGP